MEAEVSDAHHRMVNAFIPIWSRLLGPGVTQDSNFFDMGGHSLSAMLLVTKIKSDLGRSIPLFALVDNPTVSKLSHYMLTVDEHTAPEEAKAPDGSTSQSERLLNYNSSERRDLRNKRFESYYASVVNSKAHAEFCERVYGQNFGQHGMADIAQVDSLIEALDLSKGDSVLDIGCGYGLISDYIHEKSGATVTGIDLSPSAIDYANKMVARDGLVQFRTMDIGDIKFPLKTFTHVISIDSVYYAPSLRSLLGRLKEIGTDAVRLGILRTFPMRSFTPETWNPHRTELATLLAEMFGGYEILDLSAEENRHWKLKVEVLDSLKEKFFDEGNDGLFEFRYKEAVYEAGIDQVRYMFTTNSSRG